LAAAGKTKRFSWRRLRPRLPKYFKEAYAELQKVTWPSRSEAWKLTLAVFIFSGVFTFFIVIVDNIFKFLAEELFL
jgi:preprotein translocase subunit SecE